MKILMLTFLLLLFTSCAPKPSPSESESPNKPSIPVHHEFISIKGDGGSFCALDIRRDLYCFGNNSFASHAPIPEEAKTDGLATGAQQKFLESPHKVKHPRGWKKIVSGPNFFCGIDEDDKLYCFGQNKFFSILGYGGPIFRPDAGFPDNYIVKTPYLIDNSAFRDVSISGHNVCALKTSGEVYCFGEMKGSSTPVREPGNYSQIRLSDDVLVTRDALNKVFINNIQIGARSLESIYPGVFTGSYGTASYTYALSSSQKLYVYGNNQDLHTGLANLHIPDFEEVQPGSRFIAVATKDRHTCAIKSDESLWCWGDNSLTLPGHTETGALGTGSAAPFVTKPEKVSVLGKVKKVTVGGFGAICAIDANDNLYCFGRNVVKKASGELLIGTLGSNNKSDPLINTPVLITDKKWKDVEIFSTDSAHVTCALDDKNSLYCWGINPISTIGVGKGVGVLVYTPTPVKEPVS
jgi:alpha-tubulin suppressor-like RCC1 family protein